MSAGVVRENARFDGADGLTIAGDRWNVEEPHGTVMLLHGGGQTRHSWSHTGDRLAAAGWNVVALDARGHGESDWHPTGNYTQEALAADLGAIIGALNVRPVLVGASMGGVTSLIALDQDPDLAVGLVLVDVVVQMEPEGVSRILSFMTAHADGFASLDEAADAIAEYAGSRSRERRTNGLHKNLRQREDGRWHWHWDPKLLNDRPRADRKRVGEAAERISVPTLIVRGRRSDVVSEEGVADMLRRIPTAVAVDVATAGHMVAGDDNDVFGNVIIEFLDRLWTEERVACR